MKYYVKAFFQLLGAMVVVGLVLTSGAESVWVARHFLGDVGFAVGVLSWMIVVMLSLGTVGLGKDLKKEAEGYK